ncbi:MAG: hypothetical protein HY899_11735 [Deltaproteobacteria bacterium]|nr:hypothetical protein [Deltaproteobacteria bacterium]
MSTDSTETSRDYKKECLLDEHRSLSSFVEKEIVMTTVAKLVCITAWLLGVIAAGVTSQRAAVLPAVAIAVVSFWSVDALYAYYGVIYKMRRLRVREWLALLPTAATGDLAAWRTPANPFDGLSRQDKVGAMTSTLASPAVSGVYALLLVIVLMLAAL